MGIVKEIIRLVYHGRSIFTVTMPAKMFDCTSLANRFIDQFGFASTYLNLAAKQRKDINKFKYVISFIVGGLFLHMKVRKPFNPLLGETW